MTDNIINNKLIKLLKQNNMTQKDLAEATGITESAISRYVKGDRLPRGVNLIRLAQALKTTPELLINEDMNYVEIIKELIERHVKNFTDDEKLDIIMVLAAGNKEKKIE